MLAAAVVPQRRAEVGKRAHGVVIKRKDKVAVAQARMGAGGILCDIPHLHPAVAGRVRRIDRADHHAELGAVRHAAVFPQLREDLADVVDGDGKADALDRRAGDGLAGIFRRRHADDISAQVEQRTAGVAGVDGRIELHHADGWAVQIDVAILRADIADVQAVVQVAERVADGSNLRADAQPVGISEARVAVAAAVDLQQGDVAVLLIAEELCRVLRAVIQRDGELRAVLDDVVIRQNLAVSREENA